MKHIFIKDILPINHCLKIETNVLKMIENGYAGNVKKETPSLTRTIGLYKPYVEMQFSKLEIKNIIDKLTKTVQQLIDRRIQYKHSFLRVYYNGSNLPIHTDKNDLDFTLSVTIGGLENWPLNVSNSFCAHPIEITYDNTDEKLEHKNDFDSYIIPKGCGVGCFGKNYPHWREKLICDDSEYVMQIFYHWKFL